MAKRTMLGTLLVMVLILTGAGCTTPPQAEVAPATPVAAVAPAAGAVPPAGELARRASPADTVAAFYTWYLDYIGQTGSETMRNPLVDGAFRASPYLTPGFVQHVDELLASFAGGGYDPFLCAQDVPTEMTPDVTFTRNGMASVVVRSSFPNHLLTVDLRPEGEGWLIGDITCAADPAGVAKAFYSWYLGYIGDRSGAGFRNPLVDQAYQGHPLLSEELVHEVDALLASFEGGGFDPFLLAQDIPQDFSVDPGVTPGTAVVHLQFGPGSVRHLLVTMDDGGRQIAAIAEAAGLPDQAPATVDPDAQCMLRVFLPGDPDIVSVLAFDLAGPPAQANS